MIEAKHIIFFLGSAVCIPAGILGALYSRKIHDFVFMFLVFGTTQPGSLFGLPTDINFLSREWYRGTTRGIEVSYLDLLAIILLVSSVIIRRREGRPLFWPPSLGPLLVYFAWCAVNVLFLSDPKLFGLFELTKIARGLVMFTAVAVYVRSSREIRVFLFALMGATFWEVFICLRDRYVFGVFRIRGTLGHPNELSMYSLICVPIFLAVCNADNLSSRLRVFSFIAYLCAAVSIVLSISRTGVAVLVLVSGLALLLGSRFRITPRTAVVLLLGVLLCGAMLFKARDALLSRYEEASVEDYASADFGGRGGYWTLAWQIAADHPAGVGLNNWSYWVTNVYGPAQGIYYFPYAGTDIAPPQEVVSGRNLSTRAQAAPSHTLIGLTLGELGFVGVPLLLAFWIRWFWIAARGARGDMSLNGQVCLGIGLSFVAVFLHCATEWVFRETSIFLLTHVCAGVVASLYVRLRPAARGSSIRTV